MCRYYTILLKTCQTEEKSPPHHIDEVGIVRGLCGPLLEQRTDVGDESADAPEQLGVLFRGPLGRVVHPADPEPPTVPFATDARALSEVTVIDRQDFSSQDIEANQDIDGDVRGLDEDRFVIRDRRGGKGKGASAILPFLLRNQCSTSLGSWVKGQNTNPGARSQIRTGLNDCYCTIALIRRVPDPTLCSAVIEK